MIEFTKDGNVKKIAEDSALIPLLKQDGWKAENETDVLEELRERARELGLKPHHKAKAETIEKMIEEAENDDSE